MPDEIKSNAVEVEILTGVEGSQTSADGQSTRALAAHLTSFDYFLWKSYAYE
jgi:hypothetical protein